MRKSTQTQNVIIMQSVGTTYLESRPDEPRVRTSRREVVKDNRYLALTRFNRQKRAHGWNGSKPSQDHKLRTTQHTAYSQSPISHSRAQRRINRYCHSMVVEAEATDPVKLRIGNLDKGEKGSPPRLSSY